MKHFIFAYCMSIPVLSFAAIHQEPSFSYTNLRSQAFSVQQPLKNRWNSFMKISTSGDPRALGDLQSAFHSKDWFMREAALRAVVLVDKTLALDMSRRAVQDSSLIVRTTAVQNLHRMEDKQSRDLLWSAYQDKKNFRFGKSLWVRKHILLALKDFAEKADQIKFANIVHESDTEMQKISLKALSKIHKKSFASVNDWVQFSETNL